MAKRDLKVGEWSLTFRGYCSVRLIWLVHCKSGPYSLSSASSLSSVSSLTSLFYLNLNINPWRRRKERRVLDRREREAWEGATMVTIGTVLTTTSPVWPLLSDVSAIMVLTPWRLITSCRKEVSLDLELGVIEIGYYSILVVSCFVWDGAISYNITSIAHNHYTDISTLLNI